MNVYDFDKTIYDGDSTVDFFFFSLKRNPVLWITSIWYIAAFPLYFLKIISKTRAKEHFYGFLKHIKNIDSEIDVFWNEHIDGIKKWYYEQQKKDDLVISASPEFIIKPACKRLGIESMASRVDAKTGKYTGENCHGKEKVRRFYEAYQNGVIEEFYSDSYSDTPLAEIAEKAFLVKGNNIKNWKDD